MVRRLCHPIWIEKGPSAALFVHLNASLSLLLLLISGHHGLMAMCRIAHGANEGCEGGSHLTQNILPQLGDIELPGRHLRLVLGSNIRHGVRRHARGKPGVLDHPVHRRCRLQGHIVAGGDLNRTHIVGLQLLRHKLLELPISVGQHVGTASFQDFLLTVILGHGSVALIHSNQRVWPQTNDAGGQVDKALELHRRRIPLVQAWRQKYRLPSVHGQPHKALRHGHDSLRPMDDRALCKSDIRVVNSDVRRRVDMHALAEEHVLTVLVPPPADAACVDHEELD
mmetsp:Transcript_109898/g.154078  ORF Transcript_109898/g.154078 Transcript_109898/m.154078 type:complete len:282 (-) Transcript_109898:353-1198(-)